jgi:hypothetical protein
VSLDGVFGGKMVSRGLWSTDLPGLTPCDLYLWCNLKDKVYRMNLHTEEGLKENLFS